jgi:hypothetical protein
MPSVSQGKGDELNRWACPVFYMMTCCNADTLPNWRNSYILKDLVKAKFCTSWNSVYIWTTVCVCMYVCVYVCMYNTASWNSNPNSMKHDQPQHDCVHHLCCHPAVFLWWLHLSTISLPKVKIQCTAKMLLLQFFSLCSKLCRFGTA